MRPRARLVAIATVGLVPWVVVLGQGLGAPVSLVFSFGLVNPSPLHVTPLPTYLLVLTSGLPASLLAWPIAALLYGLALVSAVFGRVVREDRRLTGGLLVLAGASLLPVTAAVGRPPGVTAVPVGTLALWAVAGWGYGGDLVATLAGGAAGER